MAHLYLAEEQHGAPLAARVAPGAAAPARGGAPARERTALDGTVERAVERGRAAEVGAALVCAAQRGARARVKEAAECHEVHQARQQAGLFVGGLRRAALSTHHDGARAA